MESSGRVTEALNRSPSMSSRKAPPWSSVRFWAMESPRPEPSVVRDSSPRTKRSTSWAAGMLSCWREIFLMERMTFPSQCITSR